MTRHLRKVGRNGEIFDVRRSCYERVEIKPGADAAASLARVFDPTVDFLMSGATFGIVEAAGLDKEPISRLREVQDLP